MSIKKIISGLIYFLGIPALLLVSGGDPRWWQAWLYVGITLAATVVSRVLMAKKHPDLILERASYSEKQDAKAWDMVLAPLVALWFPLVYFLVAGLDHRFSWSPALPGWVNLCAWLITITGFVCVTWALVENRFFSAVVRIQNDRGHTVVDCGPYRFVRHPGYSGSLFVALMFPLILDALWAYIPVLGFVIVLVTRTKKEDDVLKAELPGYLDYTTRTRFRLIPGIW